jgi:hypothetical protein
MGTQRGQLKVVFSWLFRWLALSCRSKRFFSALAALVDPVQNIFFLTVHYFNAFDPIAKQAGQSAVLGRLSLSVLSLHSPLIILFRIAFIASLQISQPRQLQYTVCECTSMLLIRSIISKSDCRNRQSSKKVNKNRIMRRLRKWKSNNMDKNKKIEGPVMKK